MQADLEAGAILALLEREVLMDEDEGIAPDYGSLRNHASDNEYLHYVNHKLGYASARLDRLVGAVWVTNALLAGLLGSLYHYFG